MKTLLSVIISVVLFVVLSVVGYFSLPILIQKNTAGIRAEVEELGQRLQRAEEFIQEEKALRKVTQLQPGAGMEKVIKVLNTTTSKVESLENYVKQGMSAMEETIKKQNTATEEVLQKQAATIDKIGEDVKTRLERIRFDATVANIRNCILKIRQDLLFKNIATAKAELDFVSEALGETKDAVSSEHKEVIEELLAILKKTRSEVDTDLPSTINRVELLWHQMGKLLRKD